MQGTNQAPPATQSTGCHLACFDLSLADAQLEWIYIIGIKCARLLLGMDPSSRCAYSTAADVRKGSVIVDREKRARLGAAIYGQRRMRRCGGEEKLRRGLFESRASTEGGN